MHFFSYTHTVFTLLKFSDIFSSVIETIRMQVKKLYVRPTHETH